MCNLCKLELRPKNMNDPKVFFVLNLIYKGELCLCVCVCVRRAAIWYLLIYTNFSTFKEFKNCSKMWECKKFSKIFDFVFFRIFYWVSRRLQLSRVSTTFLTWGRFIKSKLWIFILILSMYWFFFKCIFYSLKNTNVYK